MLNKAACTCRYKYVLGANDRKMQKSSSNNSNASKFCVAPRDHFLDNAGMSESESDLDTVEEGMLIEAPVTPEKPLPASGSDGDGGPAERQQAASQEGNEEASGKADEVAEGDDGAAGQVGKTLEAGRQDVAMEKEKGIGPNTMPSMPQVSP